MPALTVRTLTKGAAIYAIVLFTFVIVFQILIAAGILPISTAWGGRQSVLTSGWRFASIGAAAALAFFAYVICRRAGLFPTSPPSKTVKILSWVITAFLALNTIGNLTSQSAGERMLFAPVSFLLFVTCFVVSVSKTYLFIGKTH